MKRKSKIYVAIIFYFSSAVCFRKYTVFFSGEFEIAKIAIIACVCE